MSLELSRQGVGAASEDVGGHASAPAGMPVLAIHPPSIRRVVPVMKLALRDARNATQPAISSGSATRPIGVRWAYSALLVAPSSVRRTCSSISVRVTAGATALTRM